MSKQTQGDEEIESKARKHKKNEDIEFLTNIIEEEMNHIVRQDEELKGVFNVEVKADGTFNVKLFDGTESKAQSIESLEKEELLNMMEEKL